MFKTEAYPKHPLTKSVLTKTKSQNTNDLMCLFMVFMRARNSFTGNTHRLGLNEITNEHLLKFTSPLCIIYIGKSLT